MTEENLKVKQQLKRSFSVLKKCVETWEEANDTTRKVIEKVADFADQYQCCSKVEVCDLEIGKKFPDLQERLLFQIASEADLLFTQLQKQLDTMKECCEKITKQYEASLKTYRHFSSCEDLPSICQRTATSPSIADMLEWLQISELLLWQQYLCKQQLVRVFRMSDETSTERFVKDWTVGDKDILDKIRGFLCYTSFFLEEKT